MIALIIFGGIFCGVLDLLSGGKFRTLSGGGVVVVLLIMATIIYFAIGQPPTH